MDPSSQAPSPNTCFTVCIHECSDQPVSPHHSSGPPEPRHEGTLALALNGSGEFSLLWKKLCIPLEESRRSPGAKRSGSGAWPGAQGHEVFSSIS